MRSLWEKISYETISKKQKHFCCSYECTAILRKTIYLKENNPNFGNHILAKKENDIMYKNGYIWEKHSDHPFATDKGWVRQHRIVAEKYLLNEENSVVIDGKRYLSPNYDVHHIDLDKHNNCPENLLVLTRSEHQKLHRSLKNK